MFPPQSRNETRELFCHRIGDARGVDLVAGPFREVFCYSARPDIKRPGAAGSPKISASGYTADTFTVLKKAALEVGISVMRQRNLNRDQKKAIPMPIPMPVFRSFRAPSRSRPTWGSLSSSLTSRSPQANIWRPLRGLGPVNHQPLSLPTFQPSTFQPATFQPSTFKPATFKPATFKPATRDLSTYNLPPCNLQPGTFRPATRNLQPWTCRPATCKPHSPSVSRKRRARSRSSSVSTPMVSWSVSATIMAMPFSRKRSCSSFSTISREDCGRL